MTGDFRVWYTGEQVSFDGLSALVHVGGDFSMSAVEASSISGFDSLTTVDGYFGIYSNLHHLDSIHGFNSLTTVGSWFAIGETLDMKTIDGFHALTTVGGFSIDQNDALTTIDAFDALTISTRGFSFIYNMSLAKIDGFNALTTVLGGVDIRGNWGALNEISGFNALTTVDGTFSVTDNHYLTSISGFQNLTHNGIYGIIRITSNYAFDCSLAPQKDWPLLPATYSTGNMVDCPTGFTEWMTWSGYQTEFERQAANRKYPVVVEGRNNNGVKRIPRILRGFPSRPVQFLVSSFVVHAELREQARPTGECGVHANSSPVVHRCAGKGQESRHLDKKMTK